MGTNCPLMLDDVFRSCQLASTGSVPLSGKALINFYLFAKTLLLVSLFFLYSLPRCAIFQAALTTLLVLYAIVFSLGKGHPLDVVVNCYPKRDISLAYGQYIVVS